MSDKVQRYNLASDGVSLISETGRWVLYADAERRYQELVKAAKELATKVEEVSEASKYVFLLAWNHGMEYKGPNYAEELKALQALLPGDDK